MQKFDYLIIGSGIAGLSLALRLKEHGSVCVVSKSNLQESNSVMAQGGIAAVKLESDSIEKHIEDTLQAGSHLNHPDAVKKFISEGPQAIRDLESWGVSFDKEEQDFHLGVEGGHSERRVFHIHDESGKYIHQSLLQNVQAAKNIHLVENFTAIDIVTSRKLRLSPSHGQKAFGAYFLDTQKDEVVAIQSTHTILATGGAGKIYRYTSNWEGASGDGLAMAYRAGCRLANMEFMQFHPTCLYHPNVRNFLITEALRGEGARLINSAGKEFCDHPKGALAPRDIVARMIDSEMKKSGADCVFLDISHKDGAWLEKHFPQILDRCLQLGIDIRKEPIPVVPAAHYLCGGVLSEVDGQTDVDNLYCIGETACTGLHGANRLASNSLLECVVMSKFCSQTLINSPQEDFGIEIPPWQSTNAIDQEDLSVIHHIWDEIRNIMWNYVGIVRSNKRLDRANHRLNYINSEVYDYYWGQRVTKDILELRNLALVAKLSVISAKKRSHSIGCHYNIDCPEMRSLQLADNILNPNYR
tara:strand:- start:15343 stop:16923 length:1581 start_codon:yes stop_codon:yes gene_type:complete